MAQQEQTGEPCSCENCGYQAEKETFLGKKRNWCCFSGQYLKGTAPCQNYINQVEVGLGKALFFSILSEQRELSDSEKIIQSLVRESIKAQEDATEGYWIKATPGAREAMFQLGECYRLGRNTSRNFKIAFFYYKLAADQGHAKSQLMIGVSYASGTGVEKNLDRASCYFQKAASYELPYAAYWAGRFDQDAGHLMSAKSNFKTAAECGYAWAQAALGWLYLKEWINGKDKSYKKGLFWLTCAYLHGKNSPKASAAAKDEIDYQIQQGSCSAKYIQSQINFIKSSYPQYLRNPETPFEGYSWSQD